MSSAVEVRLLYAREQLLQQALERDRSVQSAYAQLLPATGTHSARDRYTRLYESVGSRGLGWGAAPSPAPMAVDQQGSMSLPPLQASADAGGAGGPRLGMEKSFHRVVKTGLFEDPAAPKRRRHRRQHRRDLIMPKEAYTHRPAHPRQHATKAFLNFGTISGPPAMPPPGDAGARFHRRRAFAADAFTVN